jgi:hypothetical protein
MKRATGGLCRAGAGIADVPVADQGKRGETVRARMPGAADVQSGFPFARIGKQVVEGYAPQRYAELLGN